MKNVKTLLAGGFLAAALASTAEAQTYRTPGPTYDGIETEVRELSAPEADQTEALAGGPAPQSRATRVWRVRSAHVPAEIGPRVAVPIAVIVEPETRRRRPPRFFDRPRPDRPRPDRPGRSRYAD